MSRKAKNLIKLVGSKVLFIKNEFICFGKSNIKNNNKIIFCRFYFFVLKKNLLLFPKEYTLFTKFNYGTYYSIIKNSLKGIFKKFIKKIVLKGIEFNALKLNNNLILSLGYSHKIRLKIPKNINIKIKKNFIEFKSENNIILGSFCSKIISLKKYNLYKDKGIKYLNESKKLKERKKK